MEIITRIVTRIILVIFICLLVSWAVTALNKKENRPFRLTLVNYICGGSEIDSVIVQNIKLYNRWVESANEKMAEAGKFEYYKNLLTTYEAAAAKVAAFKPEREIVTVLRLGTTTVMTAPANYEKKISDNEISEKGKGAQTEQFAIALLSDGSCQKMTATQNACWLGVLPYERVIKETRLVIKKNDSGYYTEKKVIYRPLYQK